MITNLVRAKCNSLTIKIDRKGNLLVRAPLNMPLSDIADFVNKKEQWIKKKQEAIRNVLDENEPVLTYKKVLYLGKAYDVMFSNIAEIGVDGEFLVIPKKYEKNDKACEKIIAKWLISKAKSIVENRVLYFASTFKINFLDCNLINSKNRWGYATSEKEIRFNYRIVMLPPKLIDYVILHEMTHLVEFNHSSKFWMLLKKMMPEYEKCKELLKGSGYILNLFR